MPIDPQWLSGVPLFELLDPEERQALAENAEEVHFVPGETLFRRGDPGDALYVIREGQVEISTHDTTGERVVLEVADDGHFFGELSLMDGGARSGDAVALVATSAIRIDRADLALLFRRHPEAALDFITVMGRRLRSSSRLLASRVSRSPNQEVEVRATTGQRIADWTTEFSGSFAFLFLHAVWFVLWIGANVGILSRHEFDPFPFGLLTMIVSLEAIFLSCMVLISQKRDAARDRIRSDVEFEANIKAGLEVSELHVKLDRLHAEVNKRLATLERGKA